MIQIKKKLSIPKYQQIVFSIEKAISKGQLKKGDQIPSINAIKDKHKLSRDTVLMAFNDLKRRGIIHAVVGKGYYVTSEDVNIKQNILLLFDELNSFKENLYNAFINTIPSSFDVDIYFHHFNRNVFKNILENNIGNYNTYVIMPANLSTTETLLNKLPKDSVYILDQMPKELKQYAGIYQNFEKDIYDNLEKAIHRIKKYETLFLIFSEEKQPKGMKDGFIKFCETHHLPYQILDAAENKTPEKGELYVIPDDKNLLHLIKKTRANTLTLSKDVGIISYNDTLLKEIVEGGITTISTDFTAMGTRLAEMIKNNEHDHIENPNHFILRHSL